LVFMRGSTLVAQPFDPDRQILSGEAIPLVDAVMPNVTARPAAAFSVSHSGAMVYQRATGTSGTRLVWTTRNGVHTPIMEEAAPYRDLSLSQDGTRLLLSPLDERGRSDIWVVNLTRGSRSRLTFTGTSQTSVWSSDGRSVLFNGGADGSSLVRKAVDGSGAEQSVGGPVKGASLPSDVSADGRWLLYESFVPGTTSNDIWAMPLAGEDAPIPVAVTRFAERWAQFSPDGRWVAFTSDESGPRETYVKRFSGEGRWQVSSAGGSYPRWSADGRELYFYTPNNKISAVRIMPTGDALDIGPVTPLFDARPPSGFGRYFYDVAPDGRFLLTVSTSANTPTMLTLFVNWPGTVQR
jgi:Tol biopolymer transport system component